MGVVITRDDIIAYAEVDYIINHMNEKYRVMVPESIRTFFATIKEPEYKIFVDPKRPLANQGLKQYTLEIIALLHLKYWCQDEARKKELYERMKQNQMRIEEKLHEQYGVENLFNAESVVSVKEDSDVEVEKEDFSKPRVITRYGQMAENDSNIKDYSDVVTDEEEIKKIDEVSAKSIQNAEINEKNSKKKRGRPAKEKNSEESTDVGENEESNDENSGELTSVEKDKENIFVRIKNMILNLFKKNRSVE